MNCLHQTNILPNASTIDWNLTLSFISDQQLIIMDTTTQTVYLIMIDQNVSTIDYKQFLNSDFPINACRIASDDKSPLIVKMVRPNMLKFFQI